MLMYNRIVEPFAVTSSNSPATPVQEWDVEQLVNVSVVAAELAATGEVHVGRVGVQGVTAADAGGGVVRLAITAQGVTHDGDVLAGAGRQGAWSVSDVPA